jgi:hypothetical protein
MMRKQILWITSLGILLAPGTLLSQTQPPAAPPALELPKVEEQQVEIFKVRYYPVRDLATILRTVSSGRGGATIVEASMNRLIVRGTEERLSEIGRLIAELDVQAVSPPENSPLLCRVYMLEVPLQDANLKPFAVVLRTIATTSTDILNATKGDDLRIGRVLQNGQDGGQRILIEGLAASNESVRRMISAMPESQIVDLQWDDDVSTALVPAAQVTQLPEQLQQHVRQFLGPKVRTVGYWFGNFSAPGEVVAPLGPWVIDLTPKSAQTGDLLLEVEVRHNPQHSMDTGMVVLRNLVQAKVGKPIIIGYNRDVYGTRTMGALVILLEPDTAPPAEPRPTKEP